MQLSSAVPISTPGFRFDIHALRAWAVVAVVGYHLGISGFGSGFAGVDIFFVISGYLITAQALVQLQTQRFSFFDFWTARLRRIAPVLIVVLAVSVGLDWLLSMPGEFLRHTRQMLFAATFSSNLPFGDQQGYFDAAAHTKPLLHTWSLSIEWQFYLFLPLVLALVWRCVSAANRRTALLSVLGLLVLVSIIYELWLSQVQASDAFFSLRARAWELLLGAVMATASQSANGTKLDGARWHVLQKLRQYSSPLGWALIAGAAWVRLPAQQWPGPWTLLPVVGASLIVWSGPPSEHISRLHALAGSAWVRRIGDWSYSIYLWHWPLWVFMLAWLESRGQTLQPLHTAGLLIVVLALGFLSYRYIEQPIRKRRGGWTANRLWTAYLVAVAGLFFFTLATIETYGFSGRVPDYLQRAELAKRLNTPRDECFRNAKSEKRDIAEFCDFGSPASTAVVGAMLWGDSVADQFLVPISTAASKLGVHGLIATQSGCRALLVDQIPKDNTFQGCARFNTEVNDYLQRQAGPQIVVVGRNWSNTQASADEALRLARHLLATGRTVVLILPMLNLDFDVSERWIREQRLVGHAIDELKIPITPDLVFKTARDAVALQMRDFAGNPKLITVDLLPHICNDGFCSLVSAGQANFRDSLHISNINASQYEPFFIRAFEQALQAQRSTTAVKNK